MNITWLGTTVLLFDDGTDQILFDAHLTRPSMLKVFFGKLASDHAKVRRSVEEYGINRLRAIFVSHTHYDHVLDAPALALLTGADVYGSASAMNVARGGVVPETRLHCYDAAREYRIGAYGIRVIPSKHSPAHWYNDDLGKTIDEPLSQPAPKKAFKEGGSYDFVVTHSGKTYVIRPSCNFVPGQLDGISADVLYLGIGGANGTDKAFRQRFMDETVGRTTPEMVIPIHWDNFFRPLDGKCYAMPAPADNTEEMLTALAGFCSSRGISCAVQLPGTVMCF